MDYNPNEYTHLKIDHSLIKGGIDGIIPYPRPGNTIDFLPSSFDADPLFMGIVNPSNPLHYALSESSPCIDSGTPDISELNLPPYDLMGIGEFGTIVLIWAVLNLLQSPGSQMMIPLSRRCSILFASKLPQSL